MNILNAATSFPPFITKELLARIHNDSGGYDSFHPPRGRKITFESLNDSMVGILGYLLDH
jgi:hypothetical protein